MKPFYSPRLDRPLFDPCRRRMGRFIAGRPSSRHAQRAMPWSGGQGRTGATRRPAWVEDCEDRTLTAASGVATARLVSPISRP